MSQNLLPAQDLSEEIAAAADAGEGAQGLHARLQSAFTLVEGGAQENGLPEDASQESASQHDAAPMSAIDAARTLAAASLRQGEAFENFQERVVRLEHGPDVGAIRENVRDLCEALLHITVQNKKASSDIEDRFESLSGAMAALSGHMATQRQDVQANIAATTQLSEQIKQLQDALAGQCAEASQIKELILSTGQSLRADLEELKDQVAPLNGAQESQGLRLGAIEGHIACLPGVEAGLASLTVRVDDLEPGAASLANRVEDMEANVTSLTGHVEDLQSDTASLTGRVNGLEPLKGAVAQLAAEDAKLMERIGLVSDDMEATRTQVTGLEDAAAALADSSIRSAESLSVLGNALEAAKTQIFSLNETSEYLTERLRIAERVVEETTRREKILAALHARAARTLQSGQ
jgi:chromosome segregation ATPase